MFIIQEILLCLPLFAYTHFTMKKKKKMIYKRKVIFLSFFLLHSNRTNAFLYPYEVRILSNSSSSFLILSEFPHRTLHENFYHDYVVEWTRKSPWKFSPTFDVTLT